jgi:hypothetical protein
MSAATRSRQDYCTVPASTEARKTVLLIHGFYHFAPKRIGYRNDYCLACDAVRVAEQVSSFNVIHVYFAPVLPVGRWKGWVCSTCGRDPHERVRSTSAFKILTAIMFGLFSLFGLFMTFAVSRQGVDPSAVGFTLVMAACCAAAILWCRAKPSTDLKRQLPQIPPTPRDICIFCGGGLDIMGFCSQCRIRRMDLKQAAQPGIVKW